MLEDFFCWLTKSDKKLVQRMLHELNDIYMIDLLCDEDLQSFYEKSNMIKARMIVI
jgi:hypothetical protein